MKMGIDGCQEGVLPLTRGLTNLSFPLCLLVSDMCDAIFQGPKKLIETKSMLRTLDGEKQQHFLPDQMMMCQEGMN